MNWRLKQLIKVDAGFLTIPGGRMSLVTLVFRIVSNDNRVREKGVGRIGQRP
jgi:hypothetical protein